jgi:putative phage-type endonuclease
MPKRMMLEQGSPLWHAFRKKHLGASNAATIMGYGYKSANWLFEWFLGLKPDEEENHAMRFGKETEAEALKVYNILKGIDFEPEVFESDSHPFLSASMDGVAFLGKGIPVMAVEIKCCQSLMHSRLMEGDYHARHYAQCQHQMFVLDLPRMDLFAYSPTSHRIIQIERDQAYIDAYLEKALAFWSCVQNLESPEQAPVEMEDNSEWGYSADLYKGAKELLRNAEDNEKYYRDRLIELADGRCAKGHGVKLTKIVSRGTIDYPKLCAEMGFDPEPYRKENKTMYRITNDKPSV